MTHDGLGIYLSQVIRKARARRRTSPHPARHRHARGGQLPAVGSEMATKWYVEQVLTRAALRQLHPVFIARESYWRRRFEERGLPLVGDDVKSQVGATIVHRVLSRLFMERGVRLERTSQLNVGGNTDFYNMLERERLVSKKVSKTDAVRSSSPTTWLRRHPHRPERHVPGSRTASGPTSASRAALRDQRSRSS